MCFATKIFAAEADLQANSDQIQIILLITFTYGIKEVWGQKNLFSQENGLVGRS